MPAFRVGGAATTGFYMIIQLGLGLYSPREVLTQGFAVGARWSAGVGRCAGEDGHGGNMRNARSKPRGRLLNTPVVTSHE